MASIGSDTRRPGASTDCPILIRRGAEQRERVERELHQHHEREHERARQQQHGFDDLNPGRGDHAAEEHVRQHHHADDGDGDLVVEAEQQSNQVAGADHLRDQIERHHRQAAGGRRHANRRLLQSERHHIAEREAAKVSERLRDQADDHGPPDEKADGVDEPVEAVEGHHAGDAEKTCRAHVVAGEREAVLQRRDGSAGGIKVFRVAGSLGRPPGDEQ